MRAIYLFLGKLAKLRKAVISSVMSVRPHGISGLPLDIYVFMKFGTLILKRKYFEKNQVSLKSEKNNRYFAWKSMYVYENITLNFS
jgi:hypothetical protein